MDLLFHNEHFAAADKPADWLSVPSRQGEEDARPCLGKRLEAALATRLWPVHRLDQEVTGLILFAKSPEAHRQANQWFEQRQVVKTYEALTGPAAPPAPGAPALVGPGVLPAAGTDYVWHSHLLRGKRRAYASPQGKPAETQATFIGLQQDGEITAGHWRLHPHTGRPHQLRFDLSRHGFPILGDALYGSLAPCPGAGIALRCVQLDFTACPKYAAFGLPTLLVAPGLIPFLGFHKKAPP
jgi:tRNA pseudouridine32 synthase/23S rRNA pseudouridine746 synthase